MSDPMRVRQHIGKKESSLSPTPAPNPLKTRGFGKGIQARSAELPTTNPLRTRGFGSPTQPSRQQQEPPDIQTQLEQAQQFGYNAATIPTFASGATQPPPTNPALTVTEHIRNRYNAAALGESGQNQTVQREEMEQVDAAELTASPTPLVEDEIQKQEEEQIHVPASAQSTQSQSVQRRAEHSEALQPKPESTSLKGLDESETPNRTGLADELKAGVENLSGYSLNDVRVHYNSPKPSQLQALAYTQGTEIHVAPGQEEHLPHETWHVVQQMQGRVKPTMQMKGRVSVNDDERLEHEADVMGAKALVNAAQFQGTPQKQERLQDAFAPMNGTEKVAQFIRGYGSRENHYKEVNINDDTDTNVEGLDRDEKTLAVTDMDDMDMENDDVRSTTETGYQVLQLGQGENQANWQIVPTVLCWSSKKRLSTLNNFHLPVSCIESAEHVIHHLHNGGNIPDYDPANPGQKQVGLHFNRLGANANQQALNISDDSLEDLDFKDWANFDFNAAEVQVREGLLVANPDNPGETMHAVVVVGKNTATGQLIVLERNAGTTTGDNMYVDPSWLVNVYDSPAAFRDSVDVGFIIGKLAAI